MARDPRDATYDLIEGYIQHLPLDQKLDVLSRFVRTGPIEEISNTANPEKAFAYGQGLQRVIPHLSPDDIDNVVKRLLLRFVRGEIGRTIAEEQTRAFQLPRAKPAPLRWNSRGLCKVVIADEAKPLVAAELAEFLDLFNKAYQLVIAAPDNELPLALPENLGDRDAFVRSLELKLKERNKIGKYSKEDLIIERIRKSSPLTIWFLAVVSALSLAVIISGGTVKLTGAEFSVPALGDGLQKLKDVFTDNKRRGNKKKPSATRSLH
jgi:hypothetical protein